MFIGAAVAMTAVAALAVPSAATATPLPVRYASTTGISTGACPITAPCDIVTAVDSASTPSMIYVEPGTYTMVANQLIINAGSTLSGLPGKAAPLIESEQFIGIDASGATVSHLNVTFTGPYYGLRAKDGSTVDHVLVTSNQVGSYACLIEASTLTDSTCITTGEDSQAVGDAADSGVAATSTATLRGVTAEATGPGDIGLLEYAGGDLTLDTTATNCIFHGTASDVEAKAAVESTSDSFITLSHDDAKVISTVPASPNSATVTTNATDITAAPRFVDAAKRNYAEAAGSPTIDKGAADPPDDRTDLAGNARTQGAAPDMGAYEFTPKPRKPAATKLRIAKTTKHGAKLTVKVDPEGFATKVALVATHGKHHAKSKSVSAGHGTKAITVHLTLHGLIRHTKYKVYAVATSKVGHAASSKKEFTTRRH
jgi:hypothetical protein